MNALYSNVRINNSIAIGSDALHYGWNLSAADYTTYNVAIGVEAMYGSTNATNNTGEINTAIGGKALRSYTSGGANVAIGTDALYSTNTGSYNTSVGWGAGYMNTSGASNLFLGRKAGYRQTTASNQIIIDTYGDRTTDALELTNAPIVATSDAAPTSQLVRLNSQVALNGATNYGADAGSTDAYSCTVPGLTNTVAGTIVIFKANTANTGACTLDPDGAYPLGAVALKAYHDQDPPDNYIEAGSIVMVIFDGTYWEIQTPDANP
jgi:hypothetical protein